MQGSNYIAQYGQVITVNGTIENATGDVSIKFGYSGNYHDFTTPLVDGKFSQDITCYDKVRNNYQIQVKWADNDYYEPISWSKNIHVQMNNVTVNTAFYGLTPIWMLIYLMQLVMLLLLLTVGITLENWKTVN